MYFDNDKATIKSESAKELDRIATFMQSNPSLEIMAESYTDSKGATRYNKELSQKRAESVKTYLVSKGIAENRITAVGKGESNPVVDCSSQECTEEQHEQNRRTEFTIIKK
nr:OmpA family protein [Nonlabens tegetincola]